MTTWVQNIFIYFVFSLAFFVVVAMYFFSVFCFIRGGGGLKSSDSWKSDVGRSENTTNTSHKLFKR